MSSWNWKGYKYSSKNPHVGRSGSPIPATVGKARAWERKNNPTKVATMERAALQSRIAAAKKNPFGKSRVKKLERELASVRGGGAKPTESSGMDTFVKSFKYDEAIRRYKKLHGKIPTVDQLEQFVKRTSPTSDKRVAKYEKLTTEYKKQYGKTPTVDQLESFEKHKSTGGKQDKPGREKASPPPKVAKKEPAPAKKASLKGAPRPELPKKSDPEYKAKLSKFRKWYTANRAKPKKKKVVLTKAAPIKAAPAKAAPKKVADPTGLKARIAQKRKTGQRIPKSWLKAEREKDLKVTKENLAEVQRGRKEMAERKSRIAAANMKVTKENLAEVQRGRKEMSERKARVSADASRRRDQRLAKLDPLVKARQKAEVARGKTEAQERVARMRKDAAERARRKKMQAKMSALPGFRR